jgi:hypothetical protein
MNTEKKKMAEATKAFADAVVEMQKALYRIADKKKVKYGKPDKQR